MDDLPYLRITASVRFRPRPQFLLRVQQGVAQGGMATVSETVRKAVSEFAIRHYSGRTSLKLAETRVRLRG